MFHLKYYLRKAARKKFALGQFNFSTFEQVKGVVSAAKKLNSPVILGTSNGESNFIGIEEAVAIRNIMRQKYSLPIFLNLDHCHSLDLAKKAIVAGYDMVHFDGSKSFLPENIRLTRETVRYASIKRIVVEGEIGKISTDSSKIYHGKFETKEEDLADSKLAKQYVLQTKVNLLAPGVGNFHGMDDDMVSPGIRLDRVEEIYKKTKTPLVLHGGSGTLDSDITEAIKLGVVKINVNTEVRIAFSDALRHSLQEDLEEITPYKYLPLAIENVQRVVEKKIKLFGSENKV